MPNQTIGRPKPFTLSNGKIMFKNFTGEVRPNNRNGAHQFTIDLTEEQAAILDENNWKVARWEDNEGELHYLLNCEIGVTGKYPPEIFKVVDRGRRRPDILPVRPEDLYTLDRIRINYVDAILTPYCDISTPPAPDGRYLYRPYVNKMNVYVAEDPLDVLYNQRFGYEGDDEEPPFET